MITTVNFHLWEPCNMRCKFCFATFQDVKSILPKGHLPEEEAIKVVLELAHAGFKKITFVGGEPTLCPWLPKLIATAKSAGLKTMIVTNGSKLTNDFLKANSHHLDWIALSIDSLSEGTNIECGRAVTGKTALSKEYYTSLVQRIKNYGYKLKINTVVSSKNYSENMVEFIRTAKPERWKLFQVLPIKGQNDQHIADFIINDNKFQSFLKNHQSLNDIMVPESNDKMINSYVMVDPAGRFFDNVTGTHIYSQPISEIGAKLAIQQLPYDEKRFIDRGGEY